MYQSFNFIQDLSYFNNFFFRVLISNFHLICIETLIEAHNNLDHFEIPTISQSSAHNKMSNQDRD